MKGFKIILFLSALSLITTTASVFSYDNTMIHPRLTEAAVNLFEQTGKSLTSEQKNLIIQGSVEEDVAPRYLNHFYNPTTGKGLTGLFFGESAKEWAQKQDSVTGDYSETAILDNYRQGNLIVAYKGIGHILHLIQDMAVPAHVRNDPHADGDPYEKWARQYGVIGQNFKSMPISSLNSVFDNLASFTHDNFLSKDNLELNKNKKYFIKEDVDNKKITYLFSDINGIDTKISLVDTTSILPMYYINTDKKLHQDYWSQLHPQAVGYSSGVIEYFLKKFAEIDDKKKTVNLSLWNRLQNFASSYVGAIKYGVGGYASAIDVSSQESASRAKGSKGYFEPDQYNQAVSKQFLDMLAQSVSAAVGTQSPPKGKVLGVKEAKPAIISTTLAPIITPIDFNFPDNTPAPTPIIAKPEVIPKTNNSFQFIFTSPNDGSSPLAQINLDLIVLPKAEATTTPTSSPDIASTSEEINDTLTALENTSSSSSEIIIATSSPEIITTSTSSPDIASSSEETIIATSSPEIINTPTSSEDIASSSEEIINTPTSSPENLADHIVISEIKIAGETATDEFVELYNPTEMTISLFGYQLKRKSSTGVEYNLLSNFGAVEMLARSYFLITHPTGYTGSTTADLVYSSASYSLAANNTVILYNGTTTVDKLGFGSAGDYEGLSAAFNPAKNQSLERKENGYDSDDNGADFVIRDVPEPRNSGVDRTPITPAEIPDITVDSISSGFNTNWAKTFSLSHTIAGQDPLLVVTIHSDGDYITSITYDNLPLTLAVKSTSKQAYNNMFSALYYLANPPLSQHSIVVNRDYKVPLSVVAISLNNCDQINPIAAVNSGLVGGSHISLPMQATSAKAMLVDSATFNYGLNLTEDSGQTLVYELSPFWGQTNYLAFGDSYKAISTPGDYEMGWSTTGQRNAAYTVILVKGRGD